MRFAGPARHPLILASLVLVAGCGGTSQSSESGNTNWLKACAVDDECGGLSCSCGKCRHGCSAAIQCSLDPEVACVGSPLDTSDEAPEPVVAWSLRDPDLEGNDLVAGPGSSVFLAGGKTRTPLDMTSVYPDFFLARVDALGEIAWQVHEVVAPEISNAQAVAFDGASTLTTLSTAWIDGPRTRVRLFDASGDAGPEESLLPELTVARALPGHEGVWLGGYDIAGNTGGRPFTRAWLSRHADPGGRWPAVFAGLEGSVSQIEGLALDELGNASVSGYLGTDSQSNQSMPWIARIDPEGLVLWQLEIPVAEIANCRADSVAAAGETTLAAGFCNGNWLKAFGADGALSWERRFTSTVTAVAANNDSYFVATGSSWGDRPERSAELLAFDLEHRLLWRVAQPGCNGFHRLLPLEGGLLALARCDDGLLLTRYE